MEASSYRLDISLTDMKKSVFGCAFLLYCGGFFWEMIIDAMQSWRDWDWKPLSGSEGLQSGAKQKKGIALFCPVVFDQSSETVSFFFLKKTIPGRLMIWQAKHPDGQYTFQIKFVIGLRLLAAAIYSAAKGLFWLTISTLVLILRTTLLIYTLRYNFMERHFYLNESEKFESLD